jgi:hypothetical protein
MNSRTRPLVLALAQWSYSFVNADRADAREAQKEVNAHVERKRQEGIEASKRARKDWMIAEQRIAKVWKRVEATDLEAMRADAIGPQQDKVRTIMSKEFAYYRASGASNLPSETKMAETKTNVLLEDLIDISAAWGAGKAEKKSDPPISTKTAIKDPSKAFKAKLKKVGEEQKKMRDEAKLLAIQEEKDESQTGWRRAEIAGGNKRHKRKLPFSSNSKSSSSSSGSGGGGKKRRGSGKASSTRKRPRVDDCADAFLRSTDGDYEGEGVVAMDQSGGGRGVRRSSRATKGQWRKTDAIARPELERRQKKKEHEHTVAQALSTVLSSMAQQAARAAQEAAALSAASKGSGKDEAGAEGDSVEAVELVSDYQSDAEGDGMDTGCDDDGRAMRDEEEEWGM